MKEATRAVWRVPPIEEPAFSGENTKLACTVEPVGKRAPNGWTFSAPGRFSRVNAAGSPQAGPETGLSPPCTRPIQVKNHEDHDLN